MSQNKKTEDSSVRDKANAAFRQAAVKVIERARQTGTPVIVWEGGEVKELTPEQATDRLADGG